MSDIEYRKTTTGSQPPVLGEGERLIASFRGSRASYVREHVMLAALGSVAASGVLFYLGNAHPWTGVVGAVLAIAARGFYVAGEQLGFTHHLTNRRLVLPDGRGLELGRIARVRHVFSAVQVVTDTGDKHLIKYQADTEATSAAIEQARR